MALLPSAFFLFLSAAARAPLSSRNDAGDDIEQGNRTGILALAQKASDIFMIETGKGGCAGQEATLDLWVQEAGKLHSALLRFQERAAADLVPGGLFYAWLGVTPGDIINNSPLWQVITGL